MEKYIIPDKGNIKITNNQRFKLASGVTLIEVMAATAILAIALLGTSGYRYCSSLNSRWAKEQIGAVRLGQFLCGNWAGVKGNENFDPTVSINANLTVETLTFTKSLLSGFVLLGEYRITLNGVEYDCALAWQDITPQLRALWVSVEWDLRQENPYNLGKTPRKSFIVITYV